MNTVLIVLFIIIVVSFITGVCLTTWENKHDKKLIFNKEQVVSNNVVSNNIVISEDFVEVLDTEPKSSFNDLFDAEII